MKEFNELSPQKPIWKRDGLGGGYFFESRPDVLPIE